MNPNICSQQKPHNMRTKNTVKVFMAGLILVMSFSLKAQTITNPSVIVGTSSFIPARFTGAPGLPDEWMGLHPFMGSATSYINWQYLGNQTSGTLIFPAPDESAAYNFRMFAGNNSLLCAGEPFAVKKSLMLDKGFNGTGIIHSDFSGSAVDDWAECVAVDNNQRIIVAGAALTGDSINGQIPIIRFVVGRFNPDGTPDGTFGVNGRVSVDIPGIDAVEIKAMVVQPDGKIIVGGSGINDGVGLCLQQGSFILIRIGTEGALDPGFGANGIVITNFTLQNEPDGNSSDNLTSLALQPNGKILAGGYGTVCQEGGLRRCDLVRYQTNGQLDEGFGIGGINTFHPILENEWIEAIAPPVENEDGDFYIASNWSMWMLFGVNENRFYKFDAQGNLVSSFGTGGWVVDPRPAMENSQQSKSIAIGPDNQLYIMGCTGNTGWIWLMKRDPVTGASDPEFGNNGLIVYEHPVACIPTGIQFFDNKLFVGHYTFNGIWSTSRFNLDGTFDITYGWPGFMLHDYTDHVKGFAIQPNGDVVMAGSGLYAPGLQRDLMVVRFDTNSTRFLQNQTINNGENDCVASNENLYSYNVEIEVGASVNLIAAQKVFLYSGTTVLPGGYLHARISATGEDCMEESFLTSSNTMAEKPHQKVTTGETLSLVKVYPNPTSGKVFVETTGIPGNDEITIEICGLMGNVIYTGQVKGLSRQMIDLSGLPSGVCFLRTSNRQSTAVQKIIKQ
jgi:uncharacterized delta-60 repeat protein